MANNLFQELAAHEIPPLPEDFNVVVHRRVNRSLVVLQVLDLLWRGLPTAFLLFAQGLIGLIAYSLTGNYPVRKQAHREPGSEDRE